MKRTWVGGAAAFGLSLVVCLAFAGQAFAATYLVNTTGDTNTGVGNSGTLRYCITQADGDGTADVIDIGSGFTITLTSDLPALTNPVGITINSNGSTIDGASTYRGLFAYAGTDAINDLTIQNAKAQGGAGNSDGGGGAGLGGGLFVASGASVTVSDVTLSNDGASGGAGAARGGGDGGGGGMGGSAGSDTTNGASGGGGLGSGATGGGQRGHGSVGHHPRKRARRDGWARRRYGRVEWRRWRGRKQRR